MTSLIVISSESDLENETEMINDLFHSGMGLFHLRKPGFAPDTQRAFLNRIEKQFHDKISVHQHFETASEFGLKYFHIKEKDRTNISLNSPKKTAGVLRQTQTDIKRSTSFHSYNELQTQSHLWDYCFLSPVFDSISKPGYKAAFENGITTNAERSQKIFALGGITKENIEEVFRKNFYGAAVLGAIWNNSENAVKNFKELEKKCMQIVHMC